MKKEDKYYIGSFIFLIISIIIAFNLDWSTHDDIFLASCGFISVATALYLTEKGEKEVKNEQ